MLRVKSALSVCNTTLKATENCELGSSPNELPPAARKHPVIFVGRNMDDPKFVRGLGLEAYLSTDFLSVSHANFTLTAF